MIAERRAAPDRRASPAPAPQVSVETGDRFAEAVAFAAKAHAGQVYRGYNGRDDGPYILHPLRVAMAVREECRVVAVLHDVLEDSDGGLPPWLTSDETAAIRVLTRDKDESYENYIALIADITPPPEPYEIIARDVKLADLADNLAHDPPPRLRERYEKALARLGGVPHREPDHDSLASEIVRAAFHGCHHGDGARSFTEIVRGILHQHSLRVTQK